MLAALLLLHRWHQRMSLPLVFSTTVDLLLWYSTAVVALARIRRPAARHYIT